MEYAKVLFRAIYTEGDKSLRIKVGWLRETTLVSLSSFSFHSERKGLITRGLPSLSLSALDVVITYVRTSKDSVARLQKEKRVSTSPVREGVEGGEGGEGGDQCSGEGGREGKGRTLTHSPHLSPTKEPSVCWSCAT